jgi:hypothetical protein
MGLAEAPWSTGAIDPSMLQYAGLVLVSACHCGGLSVTADTGSPIEARGILVPNLTVLQSASVMALFPGIEALASFGCE